MRELKPLSRASILIRKMRQLEETTAAVFEAEHDCAQHTLAVRVRLLAPLNKPPRRSAIVAALLRQLAVYTDGFCATRGAEDDDILDPGMMFHFTDEDARRLFRARIPLYLHREISSRLSVTNAP